MATTVAEDSQPASAAASDRTAIIRALLDHGLLVSAPSLTIPNVDQRDTGIVRDRKLSFGRGARVLAAELSKTGADDA
jgi:hypothetical protein